MLEDDIPRYSQADIYPLASVSTLSDEDSNDENSPENINHPLASSCPL